MGEAQRNPLKNENFTAALVVHHLVEPQSMRMVTHSRVLDRVKEKLEMPYERLRNLYSNNKVEKREQVQRKRRCINLYEKCWKSSDCCTGWCSRGYCRWFSC